MRHPQHRLVGRADRRFLDFQGDVGGRGGKEEQRRRRRREQARETCLNLQESRHERAEPTARPARCDELRQVQCASRRRLRWSGANGAERDDDDEARKCRTAARSCEGTSPPGSRRRAAPATGAAEVQYVAAEMPDLVGVRRGRIGRTGRRPMPWQMTPRSGSDAAIAPACAVATPARNACSTTSQAAIRTIGCWRSETDGRQIRLARLPLAWHVSTPYLKEASVEAVPSGIRRAWPIANPPSSRSRRKCCSRPMPAASSRWRRAPRIRRSTGSSRRCAASSRSTAFTCRRGSRARCARTASP